MLGPSDTILATISGCESTQRLLVVLRHEPGCGSQLQLRQQSWGEGLGWYTQSSVELEPAQVAELRVALGHGAGAGGQQLARVFRERGQTQVPGAYPRVVRADSA